MKSYQKIGMLFTLGILCVQPALAGISIGTSRIIFHEKNSSQSVDINNSSTSQTYLINVGISDTLNAKTANTAFLPTPALFRIEPDSRNTVRILKKAYNLPSDRESLFYFNVMAIPTGKVGEADTGNSLGGTLQVATGNTVKLFYRPDNLPMTQKEAMGKLEFTRAGNSVKVFNPTPYYISLRKLVVNGRSVKLDVIKGTSMIAPFSANTYPVAAGQGITKWTAINDFGAGETFNGVIK
ncbi:molecular chaperone [Klebsiella pneumoniae]